MKITIEILQEIDRSLCERRDKQSHCAREDAMMELLTRRDKDMAYRAGVRDTLTELAHMLRTENESTEATVPAVPVKWEAD